MENKPIQIVYPRFPVDHITRKKIPLFEKYYGNPADARLFVILFRGMEIEILSNGNKLKEVKFI